MKLNTLARSLALIGIGSQLLAGAHAQDADTVQKIERVEVTGSSIKRIRDEGALPLQVITREDIDRAGITSAEGLIATISANGTGADNLSSNTGIANGGVTDRNNNGNSSANLRGLGASSTLVLLNGRRVSTHGAKGNAVDLNSIPFDAIQRVEILKDGASAIYGTDAIGGVINFILRKDFTGLQARVYGMATEHGGGNYSKGSLLFGRGDLARDGFNFIANVTMDKQEVLNASQRDFVNGYQPERGLSPDTTGTPFATQTGGAGTAIGSSYRLPTTGTQSYNRANLLSFQGKCESGGAGMSQYQSVLWGSPGFATACAWDYVGQQVLMQPVKNVNGLARATWQFAPSHQAIVEFVGSTSDSTKKFENSQITTSITAGNAYPVGGPYYQDLSTFIPTFDKTKPIAYRWRCLDCGLRTISTDSSAYRLLTAIEGSFGNWDYKVGISTAGSKAHSVLGDGYFKAADLNSALASGKLNPWLLPGQTQTPEALALLAAASAAGTSLFGGQSNLTQLDGKVSGELFRLPAGPVGIAAGFDVRQESYKFRNDANPSVPVRDAPFDAEFPKVSRDIKAIYAETIVPIFKSLELSAAVRHDQYSDFGGTTNPKVSLRFSPIQELVFRASTSRGFRAPSFFQLYGAVSESPVPGNIADPELCPLHPGDLAYCAIRPNARSGGNKELKPETSKQYSYGVVVNPVSWALASLDVWQIKRTDRIYELTAQQVVANYTTFDQPFVRSADGSINYIRAGFVNADGDVTKGADLSITVSGAALGGKWSAGLDGTYIDSFRSRVFKTDAYTETAGQWNSRDLFPRWKHSARVSFTQGPWNGTLTQNYTAGYKDELPAGTVPAGFNPDVKSYITHNLSVSYTGFKNLSLIGGIQNIADTKPPFTAHNVDFAAGAGWDPRVASPLGRRFSADVKYTFF